MEESLRTLILKEFPHEEIDIRTYSPGTLAFLGDAVYSLVIRTILVSKGNRQAEKLHNETTYYVRAEQQAAIGLAVYDLMTEEEKKVYRRGRNSNPYHHAKSSSLEEYLQATALEALCGYLYLQDRTDRLLELLREGIRRADRKGRLGPRKIYEEETGEYEENE
jgi:ribonuclease-3 family protein